MLNITDEALALEKRAADAGLDMKAVLARANVHRASWDRWKAGSHAPRLDRWKSVEQAITDLEAASTNEEAA